MLASSLSSYKVLSLLEWPLFVLAWALTTGHDNRAVRRPVLFCCLDFEVDPTQEQKTNNTKAHTSPYAFWKMSVKVYNQFVAKCWWL